MVFNLCLPHFQTSIHCNKLCADGYDVSNLLSEDRNVRRRGFKLEYFLRPPVHVTLNFQVQMELCRLDVELWPWGMDQGRSSRRIEILTSSEQSGENFQLVSRCDLKEELQLSFTHPFFKSRPPFCDPPPPFVGESKEFWSPRSLSSVAQLRISIPYSGAASALGFRSLSIWALPSRSCSESELKKIHQAHLNTLKINPTTPLAAKSDAVQTDSPTPEEFLDPLTQELMVLPMILPSGMVIDQSTLEEYEKREATWGRLPNDPFTGVPFTQSSKPLPNPLLKSRIDRLLLQTGHRAVGSRNNTLNKPQPSRLMSHSVTDSNETHRLQSECVLETQRQRCSAKRKREFSSPSTSTDADRPPLRKTLQTHSESDSHEQRLADSLDQALNAALYGLPVFTTQSRNTTDCEDTSADTTRMDIQHTGGQTCVFCSCSLTVYSSSVPSYSLPCDHLLCGPCLRHRNTSDPQKTSIKCPACGSSASSRDITRVHH
ncbi:RING finger protein 37 [Danio aesculapii]|uniref:RING finger protein 37 n=1 Tax=Danio aesculapii TaxID=1142201 RepID=UPI0024C00704|nr:RING finger protein 37 [Danio aesculapii]